MLRRGQQHAVAIAFVVEHGQEVGWQLLVHTLVIVRILHLGQLFHLALGDGMPADEVVVVGAVIAPVTAVEDGIAGIEAAHMDRFRGALRFAAPDVEVVYPFRCHQFDVVMHVLPSAEVEALDGDHIVNVVALDVEIGQRQMPLHPLLHPSHHFLLPSQHRRLPQQPRLQALHALAPQTVAVLHIVEHHRPQIVLRPGASMLHRIQQARIVHRPPHDPHAHIRLLHGERLLFLEPHHSFFLSFLNHLQTPPHHLSVPAAKIGEIPHILATFNEKHSLYHRNEAFCPFFFPFFFATPIQIPTFVEEILTYMEPRKYQFNNSTLTIVFGNILGSHAEVIVSSDDTGISMGGGLSGCILKAGGATIWQDAQKKLPAQLGDVVVSCAGTLEHQKFIFHCLTIDFEHKSEVYKGHLSNTEDINDYILQHSIDKCFRLLQALDLHSIAFPCIGAGLAHIPLKKVAKVMAETISANLCRTQKPYEIELYLYDRNHAMTEMDYIDIFENFAIKSAMARYQTQMDNRLLSEEPVTTSIAVEIPKREEMKHQVFISYSRKDEEKVNGIKVLLDKHGIPYWIDKEGIFSGENYKEVIVDAIEVAKVVIFMSSVHSNASINVIRELGYAVRQRKTIIPVLLDDALFAKSIRLDIADIDQIDYRDTELAQKKLVVSLAYALETRV